MVRIRLSESITFRKHDKIHNIPINFTLTNMTINRRWITIKSPHKSFNKWKNNAHPILKYR